MDDYHTHDLLHGQSAGNAPDARPTCVVRSPLQPNTTDWFGRFRPEQNLANDFQIDREAAAPEQRLRPAIPGSAASRMQDAAMTGSMGADLRPLAGAPRHRPTRWSSGSAGG